MRKATWELQVELTSCKQAQRVVKNESESDVLPTNREALGSRIGSRSSAACKEG